ncbi:MULTISPECIES: hypothetical protein [Bacteroides]|uniref:hypothetical protein n=1 Tax=Bacteroides TaxID=816 RepID=UPI0020307DD9|nr:MULTISPECIES: hypothetical protein [Bacteroides]MCM0206865.1 hypothetical protein [Bacteroides fragilis]MCM0270308.1 hypothetical protein [Bacteroides fragilis]MCX8462032.1 hypothetical protein [Bacteroides fragilis]MDA1492145.1 hypothetical protein [Bacteroides fragilis]MDV6173089.1 hypothetical protein [Bacteroides hominis (ex Liu et al. 2022)]
MDEEKFDQLYNKILDGDNWDYSTLDELICLVESGAREKGREEMKKKAIEIVCPILANCEGFKAEDVVYLEQEMRKLL